MACKLCHRDETGRGFNSEKILVCARCTQILCNSTQEQIQRAHTLAVEKGYLEKARILEKFILSGDIENGGRQENVRREPRHVAKHFDRGRNTEVDRAEEIAARRMSKHKRLAVPENQPEFPTVSGI